MPYQQETAIAPWAAMDVAKTLPAEPITLAGYPRGLYEDVPPEIYYARIRGLVSKSALDYVLEAPAVYDAWIHRQVQPLSRTLINGTTGPRLHWRRRFSSSLSSSLRRRLLHQKHMAIQFGRLYLGNCALPGLFVACFAAGKTHLEAVRT